MKNARNERLSEHLLNVDEDILGNAYAIDDPEKLKQYMKAKNAKSKKPFYMTSTFGSVASIAACFVLVVALAISITSLFGTDDDHVSDGNSNLGEVVPPWERNEEGLVSIENLDKLNYYSAVKVLADQSNTSLEVGKTDVGITPLSINAKGGSLLLNANDSVEDHDPLFDGISKVSKTDEEKIYYHELDPNEVFTLSKVIFFQINVTDEYGFLASKVGTGVVDVVITENSLEPMITFRNGSRFYSCLENGWSADHREFTTAKYVEGFCIVKNHEQENFSFYVSSNEDEEVIGFKCKSSGGSQKYRDEVCIVVSRTYISDSVAAFTVSDLNDYFNTGKHPEGYDDVSATQTPSMCGWVCKKGYWC